MFAALATREAKEKIMSRRRRQIAWLALLVSAGLTGIGTSVHASSFTLPDTYWGGVNTYSGLGSDNPGLSGDVIGDPSVYDISSAVVNRSGGTLSVTINTNYAGKTGTDNTGYGSLFFSTNKLFNPGIGEASANDQYSAGRFNYAFVMPVNPGTGSQTGNGGLFKVINGDVVLANVNGSSSTYPHAGNAGEYIRQGQAVQYDTTDQTAVDSGTWTVDALAHTISFSIIDNNLLGNTFMLAWAMTCANDVILGQVTLPPDLSQTPLPGALPLFASVSALMGFFGWRRKRNSALAVA